MESKAFELIAYTWALAIFVPIIAALLLTLKR